MNTYTLLAPYYDDVMDEHLYTIYLDIINRYQQTPVLEVGAGTGVLARKLSEQLNPIDAIDSSVSMIDKANSYNTPVNFFVHDIKETLHKRYNLIIAPIDVLNHFNETDLSVVLNNIDHALNQSGIFIFDCLNKPYFDGLSGYQETMQVKDVTLSWQVESVKAFELKHVVSDTKATYTHHEYYHTQLSIFKHLPNLQLIETIHLEDRDIIVMKKKKNKHS